MTQSPKAARKTARKTRKAPAERRQYDSPLRRQQAADTRERIIAAGAEIAHRLPAWDWSGMTFKAVGERAGVSERTVHRYIANERQLRDAVLQRLVQESGIQLDDLQLGDFAGVATRVYRYLSSFKAAPQALTDPGFSALDEQGRRALLGAVANAAPDWPKDEQAAAAAVLDLLWNPSFYERLSMAWQFDTEHAAQAIDWIIGLVESAIRQGQRPPARGSKA